MDTGVVAGYSRPAVFSRPRGDKMSGFSLFQSKARTAESYLAGIGASGALMASAFVLFIILVGVVTFNAWPKAGQLINGSGGNVSLENVPLESKQPAPAPTPNLVSLLGAPAPASSIPASNRGGGGTGGGNNILPARGDNGLVGNFTQRPSSGGGGGSTGGGGGGGSTPQTTTVAPTISNPVAEATRSTGLGQVVAGVGNNVESDTNSLGQSLGGQSNLLGGLVQGLGSTLNNTLQQLGGTR
jgi:hypothetical protein